MLATTWIKGPGCSARAVAVIWLLASHARAEQNARAAADDLFQLGKTLMAEGAVAEACVKFSKSYELLPRGGTLLNLAVCRERQGERVVAYALFVRALSAAKADGRGDREELAARRLTVLEAELGFLALERVPEQTDLHVTCDGTDLALVRGARFAVEPGEHVVRVTAPGREPFQTKVKLDAGEVTSLAIPLLHPSPRPAELPNSRPVPHAPPPLPRYIPPPQSSQQGWRMPVSVALLGVGTGAMVVGGFFGVKAIQTSDELDDTCRDGRCTTTADLIAARQLSETAHTQARIANVALPLGALAAASGALLWIWRSGAEVSRVTTASAVVTPDYAAAQFGASW